jgi:hypothetical protein
MGHVLDLYYQSLGKPPEPVVPVIDYDKLRQETHETSLAPQTAPETFEPSPEGKLWTINEVAFECGVKRRTVERWLPNPKKGKKGKLPGATKNGGTWLIPANIPMLVRLRTARMQKQGA